MTNLAPDLLSLAIALRPLERRDDPPRWWGRAAHFLALQVIGHYDAQLAKSEHDSSRPHPFTVSSLLGQPAHGALDPQQTLALRLTALQQPLVDIFQQAVAKDGLLAPGQPIELDHIPFQVEANTPLAFAPWGEKSDYRTLGRRYLMRQEPPPGQITLHFASPTGFKSSGKQIPLPLPEMVFSSLRERWNAFSQQPFSNELDRYCAEHLAISRYSLHSRSTPGKADSLFIGGLGRVTYTTLSYDRYWVSVLHTLADFALYAGVGAGTSMGQGQCRNLNKRI